MLTAGQTYLRSCARNLLQKKASWDRAAKWVRLNGHQPARLDLEGRIMSGPREYLGKYIQNISKGSKSHIFLRPNNITPEIQEDLYAQLDRVGMGTPESRKLFRDFYNEHYRNTTLPTHAGPAGQVDLAFIDKADEFMSATKNPGFREDWLAKIPDIVTPKNFVGFAPDLPPNKHPSVKKWLYWMQNMGSPEKPLPARLNVKQLKENPEAFVPHLLNGPNLEDIKGLNKFGSEKHAAAKAYAKANNCDNYDFWLTYFRAYFTLMIRARQGKTIGHGSGA